MRNQNHVILLNIFRNNTFMKKLNKSHNILERKNISKPINYFLWVLHLCKIYFIKLMIMDWKTERKKKREYVTEVAIIMLLLLFFIIWKKKEKEKIGCGATWNRREGRCSELSIRCVCLALVERQWAEQDSWT